MSWIRTLVRPGLVFRRSRDDDTAEASKASDLWRKCEACEKMLFHRELKASWNVCSACGHHMRLDWRMRLALLLGDDYTLAPTPSVPLDPLRFRDRRKYAERLREARTNTGLRDAMAVAEGAIEGVDAVVAVQDFAFMGGSMGMAVGEAMVAAARRALTRKIPLVACSASGGARMQEGALALMQMPRVCAAVAAVRAAKIPYVVVLTNPTTGGVTASYAMLGDVQIAEVGARIGFAGPRVIQQTIRENLPESFQRAEALQRCGMVDMVLTRAALPSTLARVLRLLGRARAA